MEKTEQLKLEEIVKFVRKAITEELWTADETTYKATIPASSDVYGNKRAYLLSNRVTRSSIFGDPMEFTITLEEQTFLKDNTKTIQLASYCGGEKSAVAHIYGIAKRSYSESTRLREEKEHKTAIEAARSFLG